MSKNSESEHDNKRYLTDGLKNDLEKKMVRPFLQLNVNLKKETFLPIFFILQKEQQFHISIK
jgi:hypothetical protein